MTDKMTKDPTRAEVEIGEYLADAELRPNGEIHMKITGADISPRLFARFIRNMKTMKFVRFFDPK